MGVVLKISFIVLVSCRSRENGLLVDVRFRMLDNVVFFEHASGNAMHERAGAVWFLMARRRSLFKHKGSGCDLPHRCLVVMEPFA